MSGNRIVVANWKMNCSLDQVRSFCTYFQNRKDVEGCEVIVCLPSPYLNLLSNHNSFILGAQNCYLKENGSYTGEISPVMLKELGCSYVILGHSERRRLFSETSAIIRDKAKLALSCGLKVILCIGEIEEDGDFSEIEEQYTSSMPDNADEHNVIIAYEPVYAIGRGKIANMSNVNNTVSKMKSLSNNRITYGGSVNADNIDVVMQNEFLSGVLVGNASLDSSNFSKIIDRVSKKS